MLRSGEVAHLEVPSWIQFAHSGLILFQPTPKWKKNVAIKLFEYMVCGLPVLASDVPPMRVFL